jgi:hypothetical protein
MRYLGIALALLVVLPRAGSAQTPDFLFGQPHGMVAVRSGWMMARAGSDIYSFVRNQLTVNKKDFNSPTFGLDFDFAIAPRMTAVAGFDFSGSSTNSEYRNFVDNQRLPIKQTTALHQQNVSGSLKLALTPRGREISRHAWIPSAVTPFVGAGGGLTHYAFNQHGDFIDFTDNSVNTDTLQSSGWAPSAHAFGGVDIKASRRIYFSVEARYLWSHAKLSSDFSGFKPIDLAGLRMTGGIRYMF